MNSHQRRKAERVFDRLATRPAPKSLQNVKMQRHGIKTVSPRIKPKLP